ncbi:MFS transporter [Sphingobium sp. H33]|uniref:MFS transporter n=1 Tax=Sphingobium nicotianae TaxID=2782607 RepID=A0A9X1ISG3_9SPHN|nr:MFS transporter [Sphingobium nicotianae]
MATEREAGGKPRQPLPGLLLVVLALMVEGFDLQTANLAGPSIMTDFGITRAQLGPLLSASLFGILVGATLLAPLGDRFGRKRVVVIASAAYGLLSLTAAAAWSLEQLAILRFLIGIGLGVVMPNGLAMAGAMYEGHRHASATAFAGIGITLGGVVAGVTAAHVLPHYHWQGLFVVGGVLPLIIAAIVAVALQDVSPTSGAKATPRGTLAVILAPSIRLTTLVVWTMFVFIALCIHLLASWIPLLMKGSGLSAADAALVTSGFHAGGVLGGIVASLVLRRAGWRAVAVFAAGAALTMLTLALAPASGIAMILLIACAGFFVTGIQNGVNGTAIDLYPASSRAGGLGWALGVARIGAIMGPMVGSFAALAGLDNGQHFFLIPAAALLLVLLLAIVVERRIGGSRDRTA